MTKSERQVGCRQAGCRATVPVEAVMTAVVAGTETSLDAGSLRSTAPLVDQPSRSNTYNRQYSSPYSAVLVNKFKNRLNKINKFGRFWPSQRCIRRDLTGIHIYRSHVNANVSIYSAKMSLILHMVR